MCLRKWCFFRGDFAGEVPETKCFALKSCGLFLPIFLSVSEFSGKTFVSVPRPVAVMATKLGGFIISIEIKYHGSCSIYLFSRCCKFACFSFKHVVCWYPNKETWWFESNVRPSDTMMMMMMMMMMMVMMTIPTSKRCSSITGKPWKTHCFFGAEKPFSQSDGSVPISFLKTESYYAPKIPMENSMTFGYAGLMHLQSHPAACCGTRIGRKKQGLKRMADTSDGQKLDWCNEDLPCISMCYLWWCFWNRQHYNQNNSRSLGPLLNMYCSNLCQQVTFVMLSHLKCTCLS